MGVRLIQFISYLSLIFTLEWTHISAFNLDTENVIEKKGEPGSLFGFSLAMHWQLNPLEKRMLLVGAPRAKALGGQKAKITGGLYNCDTSSSSSSCNRVQFDNDEDLKTESKENQWMGVTVNSQGPGGKIVTCAHRYQRRLFVNTAQESRDITGRCYVLSQDLTIDALSDEDGGNWRFCEGRARGHERFGSCQQGLSATFTRDYHYLVFGAPGAYNWKGVVRVEQKNSTLLEMGFYDDGPYEVGDENRLDPDLVPVPANSYLGFSLDSGKAITKKGQLTVVAGAPRANHSGAVVLLKKESEASTMLSPEYILEGEGLASSFGYDLAVVDLTGDGWQDIVVGAPQFFEKDGEVGGAIYAYINKGGVWSKVTPTRIDGPQDSMFGLAVENLGDLNLDGYQDIAVGAPYYDNGAGKVYIYHGSAQGINIKPAQVLSGVSSRTKLFGYSLAGNMDLDRNSYPDLAVGSLSDSVFVYRTRPVISIQKVVKTTPKEIDLTKKNCGNSICLEVEACFSYTAKPKSYSPRLTVAYSFEVEAERRKKGLPPRVIFSTRSSDINDYQSTGVLTLSGQGKAECITAKLTLQENIKDKLRGIPIEVTVEIQNSKRKRRALPELAPILDSNDPITARAEVSFLKEGCGSDNVCQSNLQLQHRFCYREPNKDVFHPLPVENGVPVVSLSDQKDIALEITVTNQNGDDAHEAALVASFPPSLSYSASRSAPNADKQVICVANKNGSQADCELGNPFKQGSEAMFYIILSTAGISLNTTELEIDLKLETTSDQQNVDRVKAKAKVVIELLLSLTGVAKPSQVYFTGEVKGESAMKSEGDIGSPIEFEFRVINLGKPLKTYGSAALIINWPKETVEGKWILYLMKIDSRGLEQITCSPEREINPLTVKEEPSSTRRRRAIVETDKPKEGTIALLTDKRKYTTLSCEDGAKCVEIRCSLQGLDSNAVILLRSRLWNSTFLEEHSKLNYLDVIVKASLRVDGTAKNMVLKNAETQVRVTVFPEHRVAQYGGLPWWIILVAILLGLLLLGLLVFLLWKCGFFKRSKYDDSVPSYNAVRIKKEEKLESLEKKAWITSWNENESYS
ncbi:integrin alpha-6 isoform X1 [Coregonus clupeaformis]|uniref:integrin alpha-6 isoform X1 n=1 Tax=Coregonus clupeaformis TaxID=59861 RepID=UPI001BE0304D|nr:integrin alpha-6 isoform X1 [Coregonus clupeaformis]